MPVRIGGPGGPFRSNQKTGGGERVCSNGDVALQVGGQDGASQTFVGNGLPLSKVVQNLKCPIAENTNITCKVYATSGGVPTGAALATSSDVIPDVVLTGSYAPITFNFSGFTPTNGTTYCYTIEYQSVINGEVDVEFNTCLAGRGSRVFGTWGSTSDGLTGAVTLVAAGATGSGAGVVGMSGSSTATKSITTASGVGKVGLAGAEVGKRGALGASAGAVGLSGSEAGSEKDLYSAAGAVGIAGAEVGRHQGQGNSVGRIGATALATGSKSTTGSSISIVGLSGSATGAAIRVAFGSATGAVGLSGDASGAAGPARAEGAVGPRRRAGARRSFFIFGGEATGAVGLSGSAAGVARIPTTFEEPEEEQFRSLNVIPPVEVEDETPHISGSGESISLSFGGSVSGVASYRIEEPLPLPDPIQEPDQPPEPEPELPASDPQEDDDAEEVRRYGSVHGFFSVTGSVTGKASFALDPQPEHVDEDELVLILYLASLREAA